MTFSPLSGLHSLPPELVSHILTLAAPISDPTDPIEKRRRWRTLNSISLVCSAWRPVAQKLILGDGSVRMYHSKELEPLLKLVVGIEEQGISQILRSLDFTLWGEDEEALPKLLELCEGLEELVLEHVDRVRFNQVVTPNLRSFSARQCTFISSAPFNPSPYPTLAVYSHLRNLDLRFNSFRRDSLPTHSASFPALHNLLLFTGSQDQSTKTVRSFLKAVSPHLRSLSLDHESWELLFNLDDAAIHSQLSLTILGLYWDAAALSLVGSHLLVAPPSTSSDKFSPPPYLHVSLYPLAIPSLLGTLTSLFDVNSSTAWNWRRIEHLRFEQTFRQLQLDEGIPSSDEDEEEEEDAFVSGAREAGEKVDPNERLLRKFLELPKKVGLECSVDSSEERGTKERGFKSSWWSRMQRLFIPPTRIHFLVVVVGSSGLLLRLGQESDATWANDSSLQSRALEVQALHSLDSPACGTVSITGPHNQLGRALSIQRFLNGFNTIFRDEGKVEAVVLGAVALNRLREMWSPQLSPTLERDFERLVPCSLQVLEIGLYIDTIPHGMTLDEGLARIGQAAKAIRSFDRGTDLLVKLLSRGRPFVRPQGLLLPITANQTDQRDWIKILHPAGVLMHLLEEIYKEQSEIDGLTEGLNNGTIQGVETENRRKFHGCKRDARVRLLRIFVELVVGAGQEDPQRTDALCGRRILNVGGLQFLKLLVWVGRGENDSKLLSQVQSKEGAQWEARLKGQQNDHERIEKLDERNLAAFDRVRNWILKVGLYIAQRNRRSDLTFATRRIADAATRLRAVASPQHLLISLLYEREPLIQPNGVSLPIGTSHRQMLEDNWIKIAHPSSFLMETLRQVLLEEVIMDDRVVNEGISLNLHRQRRNAQIRLLRIFVELLSQTGLSSRSDAVDATRIDETLLRVLLTANLKRHPSHTQSVLLNKDQAKCSARWEAGIQGKQGDTLYIEQLTVRNAEAFVKIRSWIDNDPSVLDRPSCFANCHTLVPHYQIIDYTNGDFLP
ncbi:hypothetical protein JCM3765_004013 [Sporobolomyces pararoseus]